MKNYLLSKLAAHLAKMSIRLMAWAVDLAPNAIRPASKPASQDSAGGGGGNPREPA